MAKRLFFLAVGALALTACTSEDVVNDVASSRNQIRFETAVNKPTRAVDLDMSNLLRFKVYGFYTMPENPKKAHAVFDNVTVSNDGTGIWKYDDSLVRYWVNGATYYFYAYSCGSTEELKYGTFTLDMDDPKDGTEKDVSQRVLEIDNYLCDSSHQHDLIFASNTGYTAQDGLNSPVSFSFKHVLSKLKANFSSKFPAEYDVVIKNVSIRNVRNEGDYKFSTGWDNVTRTAGAPLVYLLEPNLEEVEEGVFVDKNTLTVTNKMVGDNQMTVETNTAYVIPYTYQAEDVNLYFEIDVMYGKDYVIKGKPLTATFKPIWNEGYSYMYNIELSPININMKQIEFSVNVIKGWDQPTPNSTDLSIDSSNSSNNQ